MSQLFENAQRIFETAGSVAEAGAGSDYAILIGYDGAIQMVAGCDWALDALRAERGARSAYRVTDVNGQVRVEGRSRAETCVLEAQSARAAARGLLADRPRYSLTTPLLLGT